MTKTRIKSFSKRSLAIVLALLMMVSVIGYGSLITVTARNGSTMYVCVSDKTMADSEATKVYVNVKQNEKSDQNNWTSAEMTSTNKFYNGKRIYSIVGVEDTTWGGLGCLQIQLKDDSGNWKAQTEPKSNDGNWWGSSNYANKLWNYDSASFVGTYSDASYANGFTTTGDYYIHNNVTGAWYGNGTDAPKMTKSSNTYYYDFYLKKDEVDTTDYLIFKFWDSSDELQIGPDYESDHRCTLSTNDTWSSSVQSISNYGDKDTAWQVNTSGFTANKFNRVRVTFDPVTLSNSRNGRVKFTKTELANLDPTFSTTSFTRGTSYNLTSLVGVTSGSNAGTVSYSSYQYYDGSWHTISSPSSWTPSATNITKLKVTATDGGVITTAGTTKNANTARSETKETTISVGLASHNVTRTAPTSGTGSLQLSSDGSTWGTSTLTIAEDSNYYVKATPAEGYKISSLTIGGSTISAATGSTSAYTYTGTMGSSNVATSVTFTKITYTVSYNKGTASGATGNNYSATKTYGEDLTLRGSTYTRTGYTQKGWSTAQAGTTKAYNLSGTYSANAGITLYPYWEINTYAITLSESGGTGGEMLIDGTARTSGYEVDYGSHTFRINAPSGYEISLISGLGNNWTNNESYATHPSYSVTAAKTISVTYIRSTKPALKIDYTGSGGSTYTTTDGDSVTTTNRHNVTATFTNQDGFDNGTSYSWQYTKGGVVQSSGSGTTSSSGGNITVKSSGTLAAGTYVFSVTVGSKTTSITVVVNTAYTLTVPAAKTNSSITNNISYSYYTSAFTGSTTVISAAGTYYVQDGATCKVRYTVSDSTIYTFNSGGSSSSTSNKTATISSADASITAPTVYERKYTLTLNKKLGDAAATTMATAVSLKTVTGQGVSYTAQTGYTISSWTVTTGTVYVGNTAYTAGGNSDTINTAGNLSNVTLHAAAVIQANFTETKHSVTLTDATHSATVTNNAIGIDTAYSVEAAPKTGYTFSNWTVTGTSVVYTSGSANSASISIKAQSDVTLVANYTENTYSVTVNAETCGTTALGTITAPAGGSGSTVTAGVDTKPTITAVAKEGYEFVNWTVEEGTATITSSTSSSTTVSASETSTVQANFRRMRVYLDVGSVWAIGTNNVNHFATYFYNYGTNNGSTSWVTMTAVPGVANRYYADIPDAAISSGSYKLIFVSLNNTTNDWNNKVAQTVDIETSYQKNLYNLSSTQNNGKYTGSWESDAYFPPTTYSVIINAAEHGTVDGTTTETIQVPDEGTAITLPTPQAAYGYKFTGWEVISGSIKYNNTTYTTGVFSTTASTAILANADSTVRANFDYDDGMNIYIVGRFRVYNTYTDSPRTPTYVGGSSGAWNLTATNIPFQYNADNHYYYVDTNSSIAELSATLSDKQYFRVYDQSNSKNWQLTANQALTEANEGTQYTMALSGDKSFYFNETSNANGPVKICFDPITNKLWFTIPARHTVSVGTITRKVRTTTTQDTNGGTVTVNNGSSATVSEGTNYAIKVTPVAGYKVTALAVNGSDILAGSGYANYTSEFTINHAMGSSDETITATFEAIQYTVTVGSNSSNSGNTVKFKVNNGSEVTSASNVTVADTITPVVAANSAEGYNIGSIKLQEKTGTSSYTDKVQLTNDSATQMRAYNARIYVTYNAIPPTFASAISATTGNSPENISISSYTISALYAGQSVTITPSVTSAGTITYSTNSQSWTGTASTDYGATLTNNNGTFTFTSSRNIGDSRDTEKTYTFKIRATNTPESGFTPKNTDQQVTIKVVYSAVQKAYIDLKTQYDLYNGYNITADDVTSGYDLFEDQMSSASDKLTGIPAWNATDTYTSKKNLLNSAFNALVFKTTTVYVLTNYQHNSSNWVNVFVFNDNDTANHYPTKIFESDTTLLSNCINNNKWNYHMTYEGKTNSNKYLYSFTFRGHQELIVYWQNSSTAVFSSSNKLTGNLDFRNSDYGEYYVDVKGVSYSSSASTTAKTSFTDFSISAAGASGSNDLVDQYTSGAGYTVSDIQTKLGITFNGSLASTSSQTVNQTYTITTPSGSTVYADSTHTWKPTQAGRYTFSLTASLGTDNRNNAGATFSGICSTIDNTSNVLALYVAYDEITIYADMNGNVGTPTIHFTYTDTNTNEDADLPLEFDMVTGSESVYSRSVKLSTLREQYGLNLIANNGLTIEKVSIDNVEVPNSTFTITPDVARTGTLWLKADSTNMKTFNQIAYGSSRRTFKAVLRSGNTGGTPYDNTFVDVRGTGIITDELNGNSYEYSAFYAAKDSIANYNFSYNLRAKAQHDINHTDGNTTTHYYFDHWELSDGTTPSVASGTDININTAPDYNEGDVTYIAVYKPVTSSARCEITYKFKDFDTSDGNYEYVDETVKPLKNETYVKTIKVSGEVSASNASSIASANAPIIKSNYFDYQYDTATYISYDSTTNKYKVEAMFTQTPHTYKIAVVASGGSTTIKTGYYQQPLELKASDYGITSGSYNWKLKDGNTWKVLASFNSNNSTYIAPTQTSFIARFTSSNGLSDGIQTIRLYTNTDTVSTSSNIMYGYSTTYYDNSTQKAQHNFYIIDALTSANGNLVGGGVVYATADGNGWRQQAAEDNLDTTAHIQAYINGILGSTYNNEYKPQTINNIGFRYLPYEKGQDVFRYSESMNSYIYTFAGTNTNSASLDGQTLRVFSYFVYEKNGAYTTVVSSTYAECSRYVLN